jgi:catechol 2,3-dioxygenase-like lactoylglutathione lyase family enzyme
VDPAGLTGSRIEQFRRSTATGCTRTVDDMYNAITRSQLFVLDQDEALDFYVNKLGLEVATDLDLGFMRWLTVRVPGDSGREILLEKPGPPSMDEATAAQVRELVTKGAMGGWLCITTDDAHATHATLQGRGVEITDEPSPKPYGIDFGVRDPFGNAIRIGQMFDQTG